MVRVKNTPQKNKHVQNPDKLTFMTKEMALPFKLLKLMVRYDKRYSSKTIFKLALIKSLTEVIQLHRQNNENANLWEPATIKMLCRTAQKNVTESVKKPALRRRRSVGAGRGKKR